MGDAGTALYNEISCWASLHSFGIRRSYIADRYRADRAVCVWGKSDDISNCVIGSPYYRTVTGEFELSDSPYGTFDQGGNVWEWNETAVTSSTRGRRGGPFDSSLLSLHASSRNYDGPSNENGSVGFRVASSIPEPSTLLLLCFGSLAVFWRKRGLVCASILAVVVSISFADRADADTFGSGANTFDIEFVSIGNPNNAADTTGSPNPAGSVPYAYRMGKFENSEQMINKANTLGGLGITKDTRGPDKPATGVSWNEAARFINWLNTSAGKAPAYKFALQPGEVGYSANVNILLWQAGDPGFNAANPFRNSLAHYFLPSAEEWYKAAYYDPNANGGAGGYWNFPIGSDLEPTAVASGTAAGTAVFFQSDAQGPADINQAGGLSPYGTMAQGGNVWDILETARFGFNDNVSIDRQGRGGQWTLGASVHAATGDCCGANTMSESFYDGFRVASIPEPDDLGDYNHDDFVDAADYVALRKNSGTSEEFTVWRTNFGTMLDGGSTNATSVPEPSTLLLVALAGIGLLWRRRSLR